MDSESLIRMMNDAKDWFDRSTKCLVEEDSTYAPGEGSMSTAQQVAHVAQTVDWFFEGAFRPEGFSTDWEGMAKEVQAFESLASAREWLDRSFAAANDKLSSLSPEELVAPLPDGPIMGGEPTFTIVGAIQDHTAHHRGVLTVHSRMRGYTPAMPYMDEA